jgi:multidrug efflux pump subunit AcrA (membrane-fusion protein)
MGDPVTAILGAVDGLVLTGRVAAVDHLGTVDAGSVNYAVWMDIDPISQDVFLPLTGTANVTIQVTDAKMSLAVPIAALQNDDKGEYVLVMQSNGTSERVDVISNTIVDDLVVVTGDLQEGDTLMTAQNNALPADGPFGQGD